MAKKKITIRGADELARTLKAHGVDVQKGLEKITLAAAEVVREDAEGRARGDVSVIAETAESKPAYVRVSIGPPKAEWYAKFLEFGAGAHAIEQAGKVLTIGGDTFRPRANHPGLTARPFLRPAADERRDDALQAAKTAMKRATGL